MTITVSRQTQQLIETAMRENGFDYTDGLLCGLLQRFNDDSASNDVDFDEDTQAAIANADSQPDLPWETVGVELLSELQHGDAKAVK